VQRLKILIHGQEVETLAGHLDLTGTFVVNTKPAQTPAQNAPMAPVADKPATPKQDKTEARAALTPDKAPGKLAQPERKP
jgi:hypothetical protein